MTRIRDTRESTSISEYNPGTPWGDLGAGAKIIGIAGFDLPSVDPVDGQVLVWDNATQTWIYVDPSTILPAGLDSITDGVTTVSPASSATVPLGGVVDNGGGDAGLEFVTPTYGGQESIHAIAASGAAATLDLALGNVQDVTLTADCTVTLAGAQAGLSCAMTIVLRQDGTGSRHVTWPGSVTWLAGVAPTLKTAASAVDVVVLWSLDGGTTWGGTLVGSAGVAALDDLSDVTISSPAAAQFLRYSGSAWLNVALIVADYPFHSEPLCDSSGPILTALGDVIMVTGVPN